VLGFKVLVGCSEGRRPISDIDILISAKRNPSQEGVISPAAGRSGPRGEYQPLDEKSAPLAQKTPEDISSLATGHSRRLDIGRLDRDSSPDWTSVGHK